MTPDFLERTSAAPMMSSGFLIDPWANGYPRSKGHTTLILMNVHNVIGRINVRETKS